MQTMSTYCSQRSWFESKRGWPGLLSVYLRLFWQINDWCIDWVACYGCWKSILSKNYVILPNNSSIRQFHNCFLNQSTICCDSSNANIQTQSTIFKSHWYNITSQPKLDIYPAVNHLFDNVDWIIGDAGMFICSVRYFLFFLQQVCLFILYMTWFYVLTSDNWVVLSQN